VVARQKFITQVFEAFPRRFFSRPRIVVIAETTVEVIICGTCLKVKKANEKN
jgi:hypothetical protein